jgi:hypothetical protein
MPATTTPRWRYVTELRSAINRPEECITEGRIVGLDDDGVTIRHKHRATVLGAAPLPVLQAGRLE